MPSPIGHALAGVATAWSGERSDRLLTRLTVVCVVLAALPDVDLLIPGAHRTFTHSLAAVLLVFIVAMAVTGWVTGRVAWRTVALCTVAYGSHLFLDWLGEDRNLPRGIQLLWPIRRWFISRWSVFPSTERRAIFSTSTIIINVIAVAVECAVMGTIVAAVWWMKKRRQGSRAWASRGG